MAPVLNPRGALDSLEVWMTLEDPIRLFRVECFYEEGKEGPEVAKRGLGDTHPTPRTSGPREWTRNSRHLGCQGGGGLP